METLFYLTPNWYTLITAGLRNGPAVMVPHHCRFIIRTGSDEQFSKVIYKIETKNLGRLGLEHGSRGLSCGVLTVGAVGGIQKEGKSYTT